MKGRTSHYFLVQILLVLLVIFVASKMPFMFQPFIVIFSTLFLPIIISGYLFFATVPLFELLLNYRIPRLIGIFIVIFVVLAVIFFIGYLIIPVLIEQLSSIINVIPSLVDNIKTGIESFSDSKYYDIIVNQTIVSMDQIQLKLVTLSTTILNQLTNSISDVINIISNAVLVAILVPFIFFYMLKDGDGFKGALVGLLPKRVHSDAEVIISEIYVTIGKYIRGQMLTCTFVAVMSTVGYFLIDLPYALTFGVFIGIFNMIPYLGPWIGSIPAVAVAVFISPTTAFLAVLIIYVVQMTESHIIAPMIHGHNLKVHPLTVIIVMVLAGKLFGVFGMLLAIPTYAVAKIFVLNSRRILNEKTKK